MILGFMIVSILPLQGCNFAYNQFGRDFPAAALEAFIKQEASIPPTLKILCTGERP